MIEFLEQAIEIDPAEALPRTALERGVQFRTHDRVINKWEHDLASGKQPDFSEAFPHDRDLLKRWLGKKKAPEQRAVEAEQDALNGDDEISDRYGEE